MPGDALGYANSLLEEGEFQALIDHLPFPFAYLDRNLRFVLVNEACAESLGRTKEELLGRVGLELFRHHRRSHPVNENEDDEEENGEEENEPERKRAVWRLT
ncbi:MAG: PAS domain S-box protein, partial [Firmicutes bacterium]|nr:PAS domain S-box protein [Bacillota bacterium]